MNSKISRPLRIIAAVVAMTVATIFGAETTMVDADIISIAQPPS